jgi:FtsH-binding integral membrane protein
MFTTTYRSAVEVNSAMIRVYQNMMLAIIVSMCTSIVVSNTPMLMALFFGTPLKWLVMLAPIIFVLFFSFKLENLNKGTATILLYTFAAVMGLSMSAIFAIYTSASIFMAFFSSAILFGCMTFYGYFTKRSLESFGQFLIVGLIAIVIASIVNIFIGSNTMTMVISALAILIFLGLTAYDTQRIREMLIYDDYGNAEIGGALTLYLDFINIFLNLLQLFGLVVNLRIGFAVPQKLNVVQAKSGPNGKRLLKNDIQYAGGLPKKVLTICKIFGAGFQNVSMIFVIMSTTAGLHRLMH